MVNKNHIETEQGLSLLPVFFSQPNCNAIVAL